jgi:hypothetical protein
MYKVLLELMPMNIQDEELCHDWQIEGQKQIDYLKQI